MIVAARRALSFGSVLAVCLSGLAAATVMAQDRHDRRMDVINETGRVINNFYATNSRVKNWGRDLLGQDVIAPGESYRFDFSDGTGRCVFDLRAVLDNGRVFERYRVDVCRASNWRLSGQGTEEGPPPPTGSAPRKAPPSKAQPGPNTTPSSPGMRETDI